MLVAVQATLRVGGSALSSEPIMRAATLCKLQIATNMPRRTSWGDGILRQGIMPLSKASFLSRASLATRASFPTRALFSTKAPFSLQEHHFPLATRASFSSWTSFAQHTRIQALQHFLLWPPHVPVRTAGVPFRGKLASLCEEAHQLISIKIH